MVKDSGAPAGAASGEGRAPGGLGLHHVADGLLVDYVLVPPGRPPQVLDGVEDGGNHNGRKEEGTKGTNDCGHLLVEGRVPEQGRQREMPVMLPFTFFRANSVWDM